MSAEFPIAYFNEAVELRALGRVAEARVMLKRLHKLHPKHTDTMLQLAIAERFLQHWPEAIALMRRATSIAPANLDYRDQLAQVLMFSNQGMHIVQAVEEYATLLAGRPTAHAAAINLLILALRNDLPQAVLESVAPLLAQPLNDDLTLHFASACAIAAYLVGDFVACDGYTATALSRSAAAYAADGKTQRPGDLYYMLLYTQFVESLAAQRAAAAEAYAMPEQTPAPLHYIGESHCMTAAHRTLNVGGETRRVVPHLMMGVKAYFLGLAEQNAGKDALEMIIRRLSKHEPLMVGFGELDCRPNEGMMLQWRANPGYDLQAETDAIATGLVRQVKRLSLRRSGRVCVVGVPAPHEAASELLAAEERAPFVAMIGRFNAALAREAAAQQLGFIDLYAATLGEGGWARPGVHLDQVHLLPGVAADCIAKALA